MRICFLGDGNSVHMIRWIDFFKDMGHEVHLITFSDSKIDYIKVHKIGNHNINMNGGNWKYILSIKEVKKLIRKIKPDILNAHYVTSYGFIAALTGFKNIVVSAWGSDILLTPKRNIVYKTITKYALNKAKLITSDSEFMSDEIKKMTSVETLTVPMGVEEKLCQLERNETQNEIRILSLRTVNKNSNIDVIVKAFAKLLKENFNKKLKLIITNNGPELENIKKIVKELQIESNVDIRGFIKREELIELILSSQLYITIPDSDATSVTMLEAMAVGIPIIASNIPANNEWIINEENGLIIKNIKEEEVLKSIKEILNNQEFVKKSEKINKDIITKRALWKNNMKEVEMQYKSLF